MIRGDRIEALMRQMGLSQAELARRVGVAQPTIFKAIKSPKRGTAYLHKIARELQTTPAYLTGETDDPSIDAAELAYSFEEREWVNMLNDLPMEDRKAVLKIVRSLAARDRIPLLQGKKAEFVR